MTCEEAKKILMSYRPERPQKTESRQLQQAIDVVIAKLDAYNNFLKAVDVEVYKSDKEIRE